MIPIEALAIYFVSPERVDNDDRQFDFLCCWRYTRQKPVDGNVMSKAQYEFTDYSIGPDCARDRRELEILRQLGHQMFVEVSDSIATLGPGERWRNK